MWIYYKEITKLQVLYIYIYIRFIYTYVYIVQKRRSETASSFNHKRILARSRGPSFFRFAQACDYFKWHRERMTNSVDTSSVGTIIPTLPIGSLLSSLRGDNSKEENRDTRLFCVAVQSFRTSQRRNIRFLFIPATKISESQNLTQTSSVIITRMKRTSRSNVFFFLFSRIALVSPDEQNCLL